MSGALDGARVLVTRPAHQAESLCRLIEARGGEPLRLPLITIEPMPDRGELRGRIAAGHDLWIFTSANAVRHALPLIEGAWPTGVAAIGPATASALSQAGYDAGVSPVAGASSEALLGLAELQSLAGRRVLVLAGQGGRDLIERTLAGQGASVERAELYRRVPLPYPPDAVARAVRRSQAVITTSGSLLDRLVSITPDSVGAALRRRPLVVPSGRVVEQARQFGFKHVLQAAAPLTDTTLCDTVSAALAE